MQEREKDMQGQEILEPDGTIRDPKESIPDVDAGWTTVGLLMLAVVPWATHALIGIPWIEGEAGAPWNEPIVAYARWLETWTVYWKHAVTFVEECLEATQWQAPARSGAVVLAIGLAIVQIPRMLKQCQEGRPGTALITWGLIIGFNAAAAWMGPLWPV